MAEVPPLLVVFGPTGAGKSRLALALAEASGRELVSADSVQVYRGLDIGSAKPTPAERARVPHHGLDLFDPREQSDAARWVAAVEPAIARLTAERRPPIVCGGTGLYVRALLVGLADIPAVPDAVRADVRARMADEGPERLHAELMRVDPATAGRLDPADRQRIARALEVLAATGTPLSTFLARTPTEPRHAARVVALVPTSQGLHARIAARAEAMVAAGLVEEVAALLAAGVPPDAPGFHSLGYREVVAAIRAHPHGLGGLGKKERAALAEAVARGHRQYAKRQLVWLRGSGMRGLEVTTLDPDAPETLARMGELVTRCGPF